MLVIHDHIVTLDEEVQFVWPRQFKIWKVLFLLNRYGALAKVLLAITAQWTRSQHVSCFCSLVFGLPAQQICVVVGPLPENVVIRIHQCHTDATSSTSGSSCLISYLPSASQVHINFRSYVHDTDRGRSLRCWSSLGTVWRKMVAITDRSSVRPCYSVRHLGKP